MGPMNRTATLNRRSALAALAAAMAAGCLPVPEVPSLSRRDGERSASTAPPPDSVPEPGSPPGSDELDALREALDRVIAAGFERRLSAAENGAWQVLHGVLAYGKACQLEVEGQSVSAVDYLLDGGSLAGWTPRPGDMLSTASGEAPQRRGLRFELEIGSRTGQGHYDQWLAILSQIGLPVETALRVGDQQFMLEDVLRQSLWDVPRNLYAEYSWTLIAATAYRPTDFQWTARDGRTWTIDMLVDSETHAGLAEAACGGTHRLTALGLALARHRRGGGSTTGVWLPAAELVERSIEEAKQFQNADGAFSSAYLDRPGWSPDLSDVLRTTGHVLEFLAIAAEDDTLAAPWVEAAAVRLCEVLEATEAVDLECGALYHALNGAIQYRRRRFTA